jgi:hypothetical protein
MKRIITSTLVLLFLLSLTNLEVSAQAPGDPTSVEIGWVSDEEPMIMELDSNYNFELVIKFWVDNSRPAPSEMEFETETFESFIVEDPGKITVEANSNETFELTISGNGLNSDGELHLGGTSFASIILKGNLLFGEQSIGEEEIEKELQFSPVFGFEVGFLSEGKNPVIKSGTDKLIDVNIKRTGNVRDAISKIDMSFRGCPQMDYESSDPLFVTGVVIDSQETGRVKLLAPSSHPDKDCKFVVTITSEGNGISYTGELEFDVDAPDVSEKEEEEESSSTESSDFEVEENSLPTVSTLLCIITVLGAAIIRR